MKIYKVTFTDLASNLSDLVPAKKRSTSDYNLIEAWNRRVNNG